MINDLKSQLRSDISTLKADLEGKVANVDKQLSTIEVRVSIVEQLVKDCPTKAQVTQQLESLETKINGKISACALKSETVEAISYFSKKVKQEKEEEAKEDQKKMEELRLKQ